MQTKDPALTKTPITDDSVDSGVDKKDLRSNDLERNNLERNNLERDDVSNPPLSEKSATTDKEDFHDSRDEIEANTSVNKGTDTFNDEVVDSEHVNDGDNPARQPDRRDQEGGTAFDDDINEETVGSSAPKSEEITDTNRYASVANAQSRTLNPDEKNSIR
ncbi:hypothetical protein [uncultured Psychrobacter sp.]|uniref:hypothetical protein n=1 Tax=uncultured Psychrobacter sp. TaxID=259303 RepID=UPI0026023836|nr:hypothetical protein [uncultured Psychrobacter sp.]